MKTILLIVSLAVPISAHAGWIIGKLTNLYVLPAPNNAALFRIAGTINGTPACNVAGEFAVSLAQPSGRLLVNQLLHAQTMGYAINVIGTNACDVWGDRETVSYIVVTYP